MKYFRYKVQPSFFRGGGGKGIKPNPGIIICIFVCRKSPQELFTWQTDIKKPSFNLLYFKPHPKNPRVKSWFLVSFAFLSSRLDENISWCLFKCTSEIELIWFSLFFLSFYWQCSRDAVLFHDSSTYKNAIDYFKKRKSVACILMYRFYRCVASFLGSIFVHKLHYLATSMCFVP